MKTPRTTRTYRPEQHAYLLALAVFETCRDALNEARATIPFPVDYDTNDVAANAHEGALMDLERSTGYEAARETLRRAERAMVAAEVSRIGSLFPAADLSSLADIDHAERHPRVWDRLVNVCVRGA